MQDIVNASIDSLYVAHYSRWSDWDIVHIMSNDGNAFANVWRDADNFATISDLHVNEQYRGRGYGKAMLGQCENIAHKVFQHTKIKLESSKSLAKWYVKQGYVIDKIEDETCTLIKDL